MRDRVGIIGLNGSGKSTLVKIITDTITPSAGNVSRHSRLRLGYYSQQAVEDLQHLGKAHPEMTAAGMLAAEAKDEMNEAEILGLLGTLGLAGRTALDVPMEKLSGGQLVGLSHLSILRFQHQSNLHKFFQARLALARVLWGYPHLLILDEVTTHLDFYTVIGLSKALADFNGALILVSHDRFFMRYVIEGDTSAVGDDSDSDTGSAERDEDRGRRALYLLKEGKLMKQIQSVREFEQTLEKRVATLSTA